MLKCCLFQSFSLEARIWSRGFTILTDFDFATCFCTLWSHEVAVSCIHFVAFVAVAFVPGRQDLTFDAIEHFLWPLLKRTARYFFFFFFAAKKPFNRGSRFLTASYAGAFRGALLSSLSTNACSTENNIPFPNLANHNYFTTLPITFQIVETWPRPLGYPIITRSAWNTGKALWPLLNVRLTIAKVIFGQILEYSVHCITLTQGKKEGKR